MEEKVTWRMPGIFKADAQLCYDEVSQLEDITPENVLEKARSKDSELHRCFEWRDSVAAEKYRLQQARQVIQWFVVRTEKTEEPIRAFQITTTTNKYQPTKLFLQQPDEYSELLKRAKMELAAIRRRFKQLSELESVFEAIDALE